MAYTVQLERLLGKRVLDPDGKPVGRIQEVRAEEQNGDCLVRDFLIGQTALMERLSAWSLGSALLRLLGRDSTHGGYLVPWDKLDLSDPERPRLRCEPYALEVYDDGARYKD